MSEGKSNKKNPSSPPVDSGRPFVFSTHSKESTETPKDSEKSSPDADPGESSAEAASKSDDVNTDAQGGGRPKKDGANSSSLSSSKLGEQRPQIPMELLHLQVMNYELSQVSSTAIPSRLWGFAEVSLYYWSSFFLFVAVAEPFQRRQQSELRRRRSGQKAKVRVDHCLLAHELVLPVILLLSVPELSSVSDLMTRS